MRACIAATAVTLLANWAAPAAADQPSPAASATPAAAGSRSETPPAIPANFDPCGGPLELLNKLGNGTACVFVLGEAAANANYTTINVPANAVITGPLGRSITVSGQANAYSLPGSTIYVGVGPRSQFSYTPPTFTSVGMRRGATQGGTDMTFAYKHLFLLNMEKFTMLGIDVGYTAPTAGAPFGAVGPKYTANPILTQPLPKNLGVTLAAPISNFSTSSTVCPAGLRSCHGVIGARGWSWTPQFIPYWTSPGGTLVAALVEHGFNPDTWPAAVSIGQLISRHVEVYASYGGASANITTTGPVLGLFTSKINATPTAFTTGIAILAGESNLPEALIQAMEEQAQQHPQPTPQPQTTPQP